jgi:hypothetical protein
MQFLAGVNNTRKVIPFMSDVQTDRYFLSFSIRNRLYFVSDAPKLNKRRSENTKRATMAVIFK